jgi:hypothetical protein
MVFGVGLAGDAAALLRIFSVFVCCFSYGALAGTARSGDIRAMRAETLGARRSEKSAKLSDFNALMLAV